MKSKLPVYILLTFVFLSLSACGKKDEPKGPRKYNPNNYTYYDGVAWVQLIDTEFFGLSSAYGDLICIDEEGVEIFSTTDINIREVSNFANGIALVDKRYIIDKSGKTIHDLKTELGVTIEMFLRYTGKALIDTIDSSSGKYFDGFIFVNKQVDGVMMTGVLNSDLEWVIEPTAKFNGMQPKENCLYYNNIMGFYDALTNEFIDKDEYQFRHMLRCFPESGIIFLDHQGYHKFTYSLGKVNGEIYLENLDKTGFYNQNLELLLDLSEYPSVMPLSDFKNEKCLIKFEDARQKEYVGLINLEGNFIFVKTGCTGYDSKKIEFNDCYYDWNGNYYKVNAP